MLLSSDIEKIKQIIIKEFKIVENETKEEKLEFDRFGYRSSHFIIMIKDEWLNTPNYRGLENLKAELQVRTVLMHAWAEIEHKLAYKSETQIPQEFRRKLSRISAKLEESDEQFEEIKDQIRINKQSLIESAHQTKAFDSNVEFNLDNLQAFLDFAFPDREKNINSASKVFNEMLAYDISLKSLIDGYEKAKEFLPLIEKDDIEKDNSENKEEYRKNQKMYAQIGMARTVLELINDKYYDARKNDFGSPLMEKYRDLLKST